MVRVNVIRDRNKIVNLGLGVDYDETLGTNRQEAKAL